jgi:hypothetical protein
MNFERILLNERSQSAKALYCMIPIIKHPVKGSTLETEDQIRSCQGLDR